MPYIPHSEQDIQQMLSCINVADVNALFDEIPLELRYDLKNPSENCDKKEGLNELQVSQILQQYAQQDGINCCFAGAGAYDHFIPAAVWQLASRGEYYSAYTPYQAEASQGTLQLIYEFQSMIASLTAMDVANASLYDGASALAEAVLMAVRANPKEKTKTILIPENLSPVYQQVVKTITKHQGIQVKTLQFDQKSGRISEQYQQFIEPFTALVLPLPNYFGLLEEVHQLTDWAHQGNALVIAVINPMALGLFEAPGNWGKTGADIVVGEGQPLGIPLASGGPYLGLMACKKAFVRQMPGRIIGKTEDKDGKVGFTLTLQAREQHIRRSKATSNICTNQGLLATAATIYLALLGADGLYQNAIKCYQNTQLLKNALLAIEGIEQVFSANHFHEVVLHLSIDVDLFLQKMAEHKIVAGVNLSQYYPQLTHCMLICATEKRTQAEIENYVCCAQQIMSKHNNKVEN